MSTQLYPADPQEGESVHILLYRAARSLYDSMASPTVQEPQVNHPQQYLVYVIAKLLSEGAGGLPDPTGHSGEFVFTPDGVNFEFAALAGGGDMVGANNLADVTNKITSRGNLDLIPSLAHAVIHVSKSTLATDTRTGLSAYDPFRPFATLAAAKTAASSGDLIVVHPGAHSVTANLAKNGVNWFFHQGAVVTWANSTGIDYMWLDTGGMTFKVCGYGEFVLNQAAAANADVASILAVLNAASNVFFQCRSITGTTASINEMGVYGITHRGGTLVFDVLDDITVTDTEGSNTNSVCGIYWTDGPMRGRFNRVRSLGSTGEFSVAILSTTGAGAPTGDMFLVGNYASGAGPTVIYGKSANVNARLWLKIGVIENTGVGLSVLHNGSDKIYIENQKFVGAISTTGSGAGELYCKGDKISAIANGTSGAPSLYYGNGSGVSAYIQITNWDALAFTGATIKISAGTNRFIGGFFVGAATAVGVEVTGGTVNFSNMRLDTSANSSANPITMTDGTITLTGGTRLMPNGVRESIVNGDAGTYTVDGWGAHAKTDPGSGITANGLVVDATLT